jgi:hypothetical protein
VARPPETQKSKDPIVLLEPLDSIYSLSIRSRTERARRTSLGFQPCLSRVSSFSRGSRIVAVRGAVKLSVLMWYLLLVELFLRSLACFVCRIVVVHGTRQKLILKVTQLHQYTSWKTVPPSAGGSGSSDPHQHLPAVVIGLV